jgi:hypothetical protein
MECHHRFKSCGLQAALSLDLDIRQGQLASRDKSDIGKIEDGNKTEKPRE